MGGCCRRCLGLDAAAQPFTAPEGQELSVRARASQLNSRSSAAPPPMPGHMPTTKPQASVGRQIGGVDPGRVSTNTLTPPTAALPAGRASSNATMASPVPYVAAPPAVQKQAEPRSSAVVKDTPAPAEPPAPQTVIDSGDLEEDVTRWIEAVSGEKKPDGKSLFEWCKDGQVLCRTANKLQPGLCPRINKSTMPFQQMENVTAFIQACRKLGVLEKDLFSTVDLYEGKNMKSVCNCIYNLGSVVRRTAPTFRGPYLGVAQTASVQDSARSKAVATQSGGFRQDISTEIKDGVSKGRHL
mmetsp:Transcript_64272/g.119448  ORF Transcript_64272/g.119448 Transcript_64272/m.119448 type:complete len:298 (-) Transcript_64272:159-1052(-)